MSFILPSTSSLGDPDPEQHLRDKRAWFRPVTLPPEDTTSHLCSRHRVLDLQPASFRSHPLDHDLPPDCHFGTLSDVIARSDYCVFCRLITRSVSTGFRKEEIEVLGCWVRDGLLRKEASGKDSEMLGEFSPEG